MKNKKKKSRTIIWVMILLTAACGTALLFNMDRSQEAEFFQAELMDLREVIKETGTVESDTAIIVSAKVGGEVTSVRVSEGEKVKAGDLLLTVDRKTANQQAAAQQLDVQSLRAQEAGLRQQHATALEQMEKNADLYEQGAVSLEEYNQRENEVRKLESELNSLSYSIQGASAAVITESGDVKTPVDGIVTASNLRIGETAAAGAPLFEISDLDHIHIRADLIAEDASKVKEGQQVILFHDGKTPMEAEGIVRKIHVKAQEKISELGIAQKRVTVEIAVPADAGLRLGSDLDIEVVTAERQRVVAIPEKAVFELNLDHCVYVVEDGQAALRKIEKGLEGDRYVEVVSGLEEGEAVIVAPGSAIKEGTRVKSRE